MTVERRWEWVTVRTGRGLVRLSWDGRQELVARLRAREDGAAIVRAFEDVGSSRPVELDAAGRELLREVVEEWVVEVGEFGPPPAVAELRAALAEDARARAVEAG